MSATTDILELAGGPWAVEYNLFFQFHDGPTAGLVKSPAFGEVAYGPAISAWWRRYGWYSRHFAGRAVPEGTCAEAIRAFEEDPRWRLSENTRWMGEVRPGVQTTEVLNTLVAEMEDGEPKSSLRGPWLLQFAKDWQSLRVWRSADGRDIDTTLSEAFIEACFPETD